MQKSAGPWAGISLWGPSRRRGGWMIEIRELTHRYPNTREQDAPAVDAVTLTINRGELVAVVGPNGSGKSTLAKHLNALLLPSTGEVRVDGLDSRDPANLWQIRRRVGMVFQDPDNQLVATTVEEDVAFGPENLGLPPAEIRQRVDRALAAVRMTEHRHRSPHYLSGGQKQRVAIAGVLAMEPDCLVLDEPTAMLDPAGRREVMETVVRLNREKGLTVVLITHAMEEAIPADRVLVMDRGRLIRQGTPRQVFALFDELRPLGLDVPPMASLAYQLRQAGLSLPEDVLTIEEMVNCLCSSA